MRVSRLFQVNVYRATAIAFVLSAMFAQTRPARANDQPQAERRVALLIANSNYPDANAPSRSAANDAHLLRDELQHAGFEVDLRENASASTMQEAFATLDGKITPGTVALIYFTGYGIQAAHQSYLIPLDAQIWSDADVRRDGISIDDALNKIARQGARAKIVIVDAAYRNPFERRFRNVSAGLAPANTPDGTLAIFSAAPGKLLDEPKGDTSLFMSELVKQMHVPSVSAEEVFTHTRLGVSHASAGEQVPWVASSMTEDFLFYPASDDGSPTRPRTPVTAPPVAEAAPVPPVAETAPTPPAPPPPAPPPAEPEPTVAAAPPEADVPPQPAAPVDNQPVAALVPPPSAADSEPDMALTVQRELQRVGCFGGPADGTWDFKSRMALLTFGQKVNETLDVDHPNAADLAALRAEHGLVCPAVAMPPPPEPAPPPAPVPQVERRRTPPHYAQPQPSHPRRRVVEQVPDTPQSGARAPAPPRRAAKKPGSCFMFNGERVCD